MKYIVKEINQKTFKLTARYEFDNFADAIEYARYMNEAMAATDLRYQCSLEKEIGKDDK